MRIANLSGRAVLVDRNLAVDVATASAGGFDPATVAPDVTAWRRQFRGVHFTADDLTADARERPGPG